MKPKNLKYVFVMSASLLFLTTCNSNQQNHADHKEIPESNVEITPIDVAQLEQDFVKKHQKILSDSKRFQKMADNTTESYQRLFDQYNDEEIGPLEFRSRGTIRAVEVEHLKKNLNNLSDRYIVLPAKTISQTNHRLIIRVACYYRIVKF